MVDHTFDAMASLPVIWVMNLVLRNPTRVVLMAQAVAFVYGVILPWSERFKGYFPIYLVCDYVGFAMVVWIISAFTGPAKMSAFLAQSVGNIYVLSPRVLVFASPVALITAYHVIS